MRPSDRMTRPGPSLAGVVMKLVLLGVLVAGIVFASQRFLASRLLLKQLPAVDAAAQKAEDARLRAAQDQLTLWQSKSDAAENASADASAPVETHACLGVDGVSITVQRMPCGDGSAPAAAADPRAAREAEEAHQREERRLDAENAVAQYSQVYGGAAAVRQPAPTPGATPAPAAAAAAAAAPTAQARCDAAQRAKAEVLAQAGDPHAATLDADLDAIVAKVCGGP